MQEMLLLVSFKEAFDAARAAELQTRLSVGHEHMTFSAYVALDGPQTYVYCRGTERDIPELRARLAAHFAGAQVRVLHSTLSVAGASQGEAAPWHYIVETDVTPEAQADMNDWYDQEHLPGLAAVPGTVHAWRYECKEVGPRYLACYDLQTLETFGSPPWLAVRATDWSSRVRPSFRNTKRTMFRKVL